MKQQLLRHRINEAVDSVPIANGGTAARTKKTACKNLGLVSQDQVKQPDGIVILGEDGFIQRSDLPPDLINIDIPSLFGPEEVNLGGSVDIYITNYSADAEYVISAEGGTVSREVDRLTFTGGMTITEGKVIVNGKPFGIYVGPPRPLTPSLIAPSGEVLSGMGPASLFESTPFVAGAPGDVHMNSDWEIAADPDFLNITMWANGVSSAQLTAWSVTGFLRDTQYYARIRHRGAGQGISKWSPTLAFHTLYAFVPTHWQTDLFATDGQPTDFFGDAVDINQDADVIVVGSSSDDIPQGSNRGSLRVFRRNGNSFVEEATLIAQATEGEVTTVSLLIPAGGEITVASDSLTWTETRYTTNATIQIPADATVVMMTGKGTDAIGTYHPGQGLATYPSGLPVYNAGQPYTAPTDGPAKEWSSGSTVTVGLSGGTNTPMYTVLTVPPTPPSLPSSVGQTISYNWSKVYVDGTNYERYYNYTTTYTGRLIHNSGQPYIAPTGNPSYPSGLPVYIAPYTTWVAGQAANATINEQLYGFPGGVDGPAPVTNKTVYLSNDHGFGYSVAVSGDGNVVAGGAKTRNKRSKTISVTVPAGGEIVMTTDSPALPSRTFIADAILNLPTDVTTATAIGKGAPGAGGLAIPGATQSLTGAGSIAFNKYLKALTVRGKGANGSVVHHAEVGNSAYPVGLPTYIAAVTGVSGWHPNGAAYVSGDTGGAYSFSGRPGAPFIANYGEEGTEAAGPSFMMGDIYVTIVFPTGAAFVGTFLSLAMVASWKYQANYSYSGTFNGVTYGGTFTVDMVFGQLRAPVAGQGLPAYPSGLPAYVAAYDTTVTGDPSTFTINGQTYTFAGGVGVAAVDRVELIILPGTEALTATYNVSSTGSCVTSYTDILIPSEILEAFSKSVQGNGAIRLPVGVTEITVTGKGNGSGDGGTATTFIVNGQTYTFPGSLTGAASNTTHVITLTETLAAEGTYSVTSAGSLAISYVGKTTLIESIPALNRTYSGNGLVELNKNIASIHLEGKGGTGVTSPYGWYDLQLGANVITALGRSGNAYISRNNGITWAVLPPPAGERMVALGSGPGSSSHGDINCLTASNKIYGYTASTGVWAPGVHLTSLSAAELGGRTLSLLIESLTTILTATNGDIYHYASASWIPNIHVGHTWTGINTVTDTTGITAVLLAEDGFLAVVKMYTAGNVQWIDESLITTLPSSELWQDLTYINSKHYVLSLSGKVYKGAWYASEGFTPHVALPMGEEWVSLKVYTVSSVETLCAVSKSGKVYKKTAAATSWTFVKDLGGDAVTRTTGAAGTVTLNGQTYTFPGGVGGIADTKVFDIPLSGQVIAELGFSIPSEGQLTVSHPFTATAASIGAPSLISSDGLSIEFPGGRGGPATNTTRNIDFLASDNAGSVSTSLYSAGAWTLPSSILPDVNTAQLNFGISIAMDNSGTRMVVGAPGFDSSKGCVYVFMRINGGWVQQHRLTATDGINGDSFGCAVAMTSDGTQIVVGANGVSGSRGALYRLALEDSAWVQKQKLIYALAEAGDALGTSVDLSADGAVIIGGVPGLAVSGSVSAGGVVVFKYQGDQHLFETLLTPSAYQANAQTGISVTIDDLGNVICAGAPGATVTDLTNNGLVYTWANYVNTWVEDITLQRTNTLNAGDSLGSCVALSGDCTYLAAAAPYADYASKSDSGVVAVFEQ